MIAIKRSDLRKIRSFVQWTVFLIVLYAGISFSFFVQALERGDIPSFPRSPSIEGFMPIGALMASKLWIAEGVFDPVHPAALVIFLGAISLAVVLKKSFCSWICPVGTISEAVGNTGKKVFGKNYALPRSVDYTLRSLKYILMLFFLYVILIKMDPPQIALFLHTPYWRIADIKLLKFFTEMSLTTMVTLGILSGVSLLYKNFWCRYLCPYGGLLGLLSMLSPVKIRRDEARCIQCEACAKNCPSRIPVHTKRVIRTPECTGCLTCVSHCPAQGALDAAVAGRKTIRPELFAALVVILFFGLIMLAKAAGLWHSAVSPQELMLHIPSLQHMAHP